MGCPEGMIPGAGGSGCVNAPAGGGRILDDTGSTTIGPIKRTKTSNPRMGGLGNFGGTSMKRGGRTTPKKYPHGGAFPGGYCTAPEGSPSAMFTDCSQLTHSECGQEWGCIWNPPHSLPPRPRRLRQQRTAPRASSPPGQHPRRRPGF